MAITRRQFALVAGAGVASPRVRGQSGDSFANPPQAARPSTYWVWLNGYTDQKQLTRELEELAKAGVSAVYVLEIGALRSPQVPAGPAYMSDESVKAFAHVIREAGRLGLEAGITNASSWNSGGAWVTEEHASKGLYHSRIAIEGPVRFAEVLPSPKIQGRYQDVAVLAVPEVELLPGYDFTLDLAPGTHTVNRVVLHNTGPQFAAKEFAVFASAAGPDAAEFREVVRGTLERRDGPQEFRFPPAPARYLKLRLLSGYDSSGRIELAEFEGWSADGRNVVTLVLPDGRKTVGGLLHATADIGAENIQDARLTGAGSWSAEGPLPPRADLSAVIDLTDKLDAAGRLTWDAPKGRWSVYRFVSAGNGERLKAPSPQSHGLIIDHFNADAARMHTGYMLARLQSQIPDLRKSALKYFYVCSYEVRGSIWTPNLPEEFRRRRGYEMKRYLPVLAGAAIDNEDVSQRFRIDYRRTVSDLFVENFYRTTREIVNRHGLQLVAEAGGPGWPLHQVPVDALKASGELDVARGEFWMRDRGIWVVKETACAAHIYGKKLVQMEAFTSFAHWQYGPADMKPVADRAFCEGMNHVVWHTMPHVPPEAGKPGWTYHAGTHFGPAETWWPMGKPFLDYLARCSWMLRQGLFVADVCYYYGERGFNFVQPKQVDPSLGFGFDYDVTNSDVILNRMSVKNGRIVLPDGMTYEVLVLPDYPDMDLDVLQRLEQFANQGAAIVGRKPIRATGLRNYPACDRQVRELANRLWDSGKILSGVPLREVLKRRGVGPDFSFSGDADLDYIHRRDGSRDIYFVRNRRPEWAEVRCEFRAKGPAEFRDPVSGRTRAAAWPLTLPPYGSMFVVFGGSGKPAAAPRNQTSRAIELTGPWDAMFPGGPVRFDRLASWSEHTDPAVRYFSGTATYKRRFDVTATGKPIYLDLGAVGAIARVKVNGKEAGIAWTPPFRVEITAFAKPGDNELEIEVANTWLNRLTGDALGVGRKTTNTSLAWRKDTPLLPSGLLGPVRLLMGGEADQRI